MKIFNTCSSARNKKRKFTTIALGRKNDEKSFSVGEKPNSLQEEELPKLLREEFWNGNRRSLQCCGAKNPRKVVLESFSQEYTDYFANQLLAITLKRQSKNVFTCDNVKRTRVTV